MVDWTRLYWLCSNSMKRYFGLSTCLEFQSSNENHSKEKAVDAENRNHCHDRCVSGRGASSICLSP